MERKALESKFKDIREVTSVNEEELEKAGLYGEELHFKINIFTLLTGKFESIATRPIEPDWLDGGFKGAFRAFLTIPKQTNTAFDPVILKEWRLLRDRWESFKKWVREILSFVNSILKTLVSFFLGGAILALGKDDRISTATEVKKFQNAAMAADSIDV